MLLLQPLLTRIFCISDPLQVKRFILPGMDSNAVLTGNILKLGIRGMKPDMPVPGGHSTDGFRSRVAAIEDKNRMWKLPARLLKHAQQVEAAGVKNGLRRALQGDRRI